MKSCPSPKRPHHSLEKTAGASHGVSQREAKCKRTPKHMVHSGWGLDVPPKFR